MYYSQVILPPETKKPKSQPTLVLDFAKSQTVDPRITFTRNSIATYFDRNGVMQIAAANTPRIDYDPVTGECKGLLIEEARTNMLTYSEQFDSVVWGQVATITKPSSISAPDGSISARKLELSVDATYADKRRLNVAVTIGSTYTVSIYYKAGSISDPGIQIDDGTSSRVRFNLATEDSILQAGSGFTSYGIVNCGTGWYRCYVSFTAANATIGIRFQATTLTATAGNYVYIWGAQLEQGSFPTSYIPSTDTFTSRASTATYVGSDGLIKTAAINEARYQYNPNNLSVPPKLLLEQARTNLVKNSGFDSVGAWTVASNSLLTLNATASPDGAVTAAKHEVTATGTAHWRGQSFAVSSGAYALSIYVKRGNVDWVYFGVSQSTDNYGMYFNLSTGATGAALGNATGYLSHVGDGWYRLVIFTSLIAGTATSGLPEAVQGDNSQSVVAGDFCYVWGAQLELGAFPTSYIPTTTIAVTCQADVSTSASTTRPADEPIMTGTNVTSWYNPKEGTFFVEAKPPATTLAAQGLFFVRSVDTGWYRTGMYVYQTVSFRRDDANGYHSANSQVGIPQNGTSFTAVGSYSESDVSVAFKGVVSSPTPAIETSKVEYFIIGKFDKYLCGHIKSIKYYPTRLSNTELQALTV